MSGNVSELNFIRKFITSNWVYISSTLCFDYYCLMKGENLGKKRRKTKKGAHFEMYLFVDATYSQALSVLMKKFCCLKIYLNVLVIGLHLMNVQVVTKIDSAFWWIGNLFGCSHFMIKFHIKYVLPPASLVTKNHIRLMKFLAIKPTFLHESMSSLLILSNLDLHKM